MQRAAQAGVFRILIPGLNITSSQSVVRLADSHPMLYAAVGVHPTDAAVWERKTLNELRGIASGSSKVVAIGEIGLDYYWNSAPHELQGAVLREQLNLAAELGLPVILHMREAKDAPFGSCGVDLLQILEQWCGQLHAGRSPLANRPGVLHSFSGTLETAQSAMRLGFCIGVTGPVTFENASQRKDIITALPLDHLLIETDAPFLAPHPYRGKRNEPAYVRLIADKIALLHSCSLDRVAEVTSKNAERLFAWKETA